MTSATPLTVGSTEPTRPRIFNIGLNKTGTTSLHHALMELGFTSLHWGGPEVRRAVEAAAADGRPLLDGLDPAIDAFSDIEALSTAFELLDRQYPGSRFVLTVRPIDDWVDSRRRHVERNIERKARGDYDGDFLRVDEPAWRELYERHHAAARAYFAGRPEFLEIDITAGEGWETLCPLLDVDAPPTPFPRRNQNPVVPSERAGVVTEWNLGDD